MYQSHMHPTLYMPAKLAPSKLLQVINEHTVTFGKEGAPGDVDSFDNVRRVVICTEDSVSDEELPQALINLGDTLENIDENAQVCVYVRVRNQDVFKYVLELPGITNVTGFVIPKAEPVSFPQYADQLVDSEFLLMPILEASNMVALSFREHLREILMNYKERIDCVRIGANDMLGHLGIRRDPHQLTVYEGPVGQTILAVINEFRGINRFAITAPVFECYGSQYDMLFRRELHRSVSYGLFGQTTIHPRHLRIISDLYRVANDDLVSARSILDSDAAVNGLNGRMDEKSVHSEWAKQIVDRAALFGTASPAALDPADDNVVSIAG